MASSVATKFSLNNPVVGGDIEIPKEVVSTTYRFDAARIFAETGKGRSYLDELKLLKANGYRIEDYGNFWRLINE